MESNMARRDKTDAWDERREQPQGEATPRPEDVATSPSEQCTFHYPLPIQFKDHLEVLQCILKREHSGQHRAATGETWRGSWEGQAQTEGGEKPDLKWCVVCGALQYTVGDTCKRCERPASPPAQPAGGAREFVIEWAKQYKETYLQVDDIAACAEAYTAEQVRQADAWKKVAEERKKLADSLLDEVTQLRQERDAELSSHVVNITKLQNQLDIEHLARERAEKALRRLVEWDKKYPRDRKYIVQYGDIQQSEKELDAICDEAAASLKSSEGTK